MNKEIYLSLKEDINSDIFAEMATEALICEVKLSPKAGLVTAKSNGSHRDMNFETFQISAMTLKSYFKECVEHYKKYDLEDKKFFLELRELGKNAEKEMLKATKGINTHKGTIFSMGILLAVLFALLNKNKEISLSDLSEQIKLTCLPLQNELGTKIDNTSGEKIFQKYGIQGARGLALSGYEIVLEDGIKKLLFFLDKLSIESSLILILFYYMANIDDTNIINRSNIDVLKSIKVESKILFEKNLKILDENLISSDMAKLNEDFIKKNISPGGSADLLILTIFMYFFIKNLYRI